MTQGDLFVQRRGIKSISIIKIWQKKKKKFCEEWFLDPDIFYIFTLTVSKA